MAWEIERGTSVIALDVMQRNARTELWVRAEKKLKRSKAVFGVAALGVVVSALCLMLFWSVEIDDGASALNNQRDSGIARIDQEGRVLEGGVRVEAENLTRVEEEPNEPSGSVRKLFSDPDYDDPAYQLANELASSLLSRIDSWSRNQIVQINSDVFDDMLQQMDGADLGQLQLNASFDISPFADLPCRWSLIDRVSPDSGSVRVNQGQRIRAAYSQCESGPVMSAVFQINRVGDPSDHFVNIALHAGQWGIFSVKSLGDTGYFLAYRDDEASGRQQIE